MIGLKNLKGNIYSNSFLLFVVEAAAEASNGIFISSKLGRKFTLIIFTFLYGMCCIMSYVLFGNEKTVLVFYLLTRFFSMSCPATYMTYTFEAYPISVRGLAQGINGGFNSAGGMAIPVVIELLSERKLYLLYSCGAVLCASLAFMLKETKDVEIKDNIDEVEELMKNKAEEMIEQN